MLHQIAHVGQGHQGPFYLLFADPCFLGDGLHPWKRHPGFQVGVGLDDEINDHRIWAEFGTVAAGDHGPEDVEPAGVRPEEFHLFGHGPTPDGAGGHAVALAALAARRRYRADSGR